MSQDVPSANVQTHLYDSTLTEKLTNTGGWARLTLMEKTKNSTGDYPIGTYNVTATYATYFSQTLVDMNGNRQVTLKLEDLVIPESLSLQILPLLMATALLAVILGRRRRSSAHALL